MKILVTGSDGFIAKNLIAHLNEAKKHTVVTFSRSNSRTSLEDLVKDCDFIFHLAGINRPKNPIEFEEGNRDLTVALCSAVEASGRRIPVAFSSSIQAENDNPYGRSKLDAEHALLNLSKETGSPVYIYRLPNIFGKWALPNYNSAVATFCHNIARDLPITINDPHAVIRLVYIDDLVSNFLNVLEGSRPESPYCAVSPEYKISVGELASAITSFKQSRDTMIIDSVGTDLTRALYSTYVSYLPTDRFSYSLVKHEDPRGVFVEMLKTKDSGQFSFFTAHPGITRGGHYHHTKTEKFLVISGTARFRFRNILTDEYYELATSGDTPTVVETVPGWNHDITNIGDGEMIVMLWANEIFDREHPDTYARAM